MGRAVDVEDSSIGADDGLGSGMGIRVALEAVDDSGRPFRLLSHVFAVLGQFNVVWRAQTGAVRRVIHLHCGLFRVVHIDGRRVGEVKCGMARCVARARRAGHRWGDAWNVGDKDSGDKEKCPKRMTIPSKLAQREGKSERERAVQRGAGREQKVSFQWFRATSVSHPLTVVLADMLLLLRLLRLLLRPSSSSVFFL